MDNIIYFIYDSYARLYSNISYENFSHIHSHLHYTFQSVINIS
jgi:hypothetical protein